MKKRRLMTAFFWTGMLFFICPAILAAESSCRLGLCADKIVGPLTEIRDEESAGKEETAPETMRMDVVPETRPVSLTDGGNKEAVIADITGIQRKGARVIFVSLNVGANRKVREGASGAILNSRGLALAGVNVRRVYPETCLAEVIALSREIDGWTKVVIADKR